MPRPLLTLLTCALLATVGSGTATALPHQPGTATAVPHQPGTATAVPRTVARVAPVGDYGWPLPGFPRVGRAFDPPDGPYGAGHRGVDLVAAAGSPVLAAGAGTVVFAGPLAGRGVVSVQHPDGLRTTYEPVTATVHAGELVARGAVLGRLDPGHAGCPAAACLHWGVRRGAAEYLDPLRLIGRWEVRLLPWEG